MRLLRWTSSKTQEKSKDRFDKHATIRYFKFLVKVLIKGNKTPIGLGLENFQGPFYIWEVGRPLFLVRPSAITQSSVGSYHTTRLIKIHLLRLTSQLMFVFLCQLQNCHVRDMLLSSYLENFSEALDLKGVNPLLLSWLASKSHNHTAIRTGEGFYRGKLWSFHLYLWCSRCCLAYAPAIGILFELSVVLPPLLFTLAPRYVKLSISSVSLFFSVRLAKYFQHIEFLGIHFHPHFCCHPALLWVHC